MEKVAQQDALNRFLAQSGVDADSNAARLLTYVVSETIAGRGAGIKAVTIAQDVFQRGSEFDPAKDSIVRVEFKRLRDSLDHDYSTTGAQDPVRISIPKGTYAPQFDVQAGRPVRRHFEFRRLVAGNMGRLAIALCAALLVSGMAFQFFGGAPPKGPVIDSSPRLAVVSEPGTEEVLRITRETPPIFRGIDTVIGGQDDADFELRLAHQGDVVQVSLVDTWDRRELTFKTFDVAPDGMLVSPEDEAALQSWLTSIAQRNGQIDSRVYKTRQLRGEIRCIALVEEYFVNQTDQRHRDAISCIRNFTRTNAPTVRTHVGLSAMYREEFTDRRNQQPGDPLVRAANEARAAIGLDPFAAEAHYTLMTVLFISGATNEAIRSGDKAVALNPLDAEILGGYAARLNVLGYHERALEMFRKAERLAPVDPGWRVYGVFLAQFGLGDVDAASDTAQAFLGTRNPLYLAARAIGCNHKGDAACAAEAMTALRAAEPDIRDMYERRNYDPALVDKLMVALAI